VHPKMSCHKWPIPITKSISCSQHELISITNPLRLHISSIIHEYNPLNIKRVTGLPLNNYLKTPFR
jgi:hypothetical protein